MCALRLVHHDPTIVFTNRWRRCPQKEHTSEATFADSVSTRLRSPQGVQTLAVGEPARPAAIRTRRGERLAVLSSSQLYNQSVILAELVDRPPLDRLRGQTDGRTTPVRPEDRSSGRQVTWIDEALDCRRSAPQSLRIVCSGRLRLSWTGTEIRLRALSIGYAGSRHPARRTAVTAPWATDTTNEWRRESTTSWGGHRRFGVRATGQAGRRSPVAGSVPTRT